VTLLIVAEREKSTELNFNSFHHHHLVSHLFYKTQMCWLVAVRHCLMKGMSIHA
jgi:hypothetical protein